jgi:phenylacetate-CoA ligase
MDLYRPLLEKVLFPTFEAARGRPTVPLLQFLRGSEHWSLDALHELQVGLLRRLVRHAATHTAHYRALLADRGLLPEDFATVDDLRHLPLLDRDEARRTLDARTAAMPRVVMEQAIDRTVPASVPAPGAAAPVMVRYNAEARHWHDASRLRSYGWAGYRVGMRTLHYWGEPAARGLLARGKLALERRMKRDLYLDCVVRSEYALAEAVRRLQAFEPEVIIAYAAGAAALARHVNDNGLRTWRDIPVIIAAERLWPHDRNQIADAFGPAFETYGSREVMLIGSECEAHDGLHTAMENLIVELVVREPTGGVRAARPGEVGEVAITDLHNLACPMIRYITGDVAVARAESRCACGRGLASIEPLDGRVIEPLAPDVRAHAFAGDIPLTSAGRRKVLGVAPAARRAAMLA